MPRHSIIFRNPEKVSLCFRTDFFSALTRNKVSLVLHDYSNSMVATGFSLAARSV